MHKLKTVAVEICDVGGIVAGGEVDAIRWFTFVGAACSDCRCVSGVDQFIGSAYDPEVEPGFAALALT